MRWITLVIVAGLLTLAGCGTASPDRDSSAAEAPIGTGKIADYDFSGTTLSGADFDGRTLEGEPVVLWFWAPWCPTCRAQSGNVSDLAKKYDGRVAVVGVGGLDSGSAIESLAEQIPNVTHVVDPEGAVWRHFGVSAQSTYTVISADGEIISEGYLDDAQLNTLAAQLVGSA